MSFVPPNQFFAKDQSTGDLSNDLSNWCYTTGSVDQTLELGQAIGRAAVPGTVLALSGNLGSGKTHLTQGIAMGLGINRKLVNSPTFSLVQEYAGRLPVFHFDTYRLRNVDEFLELGFDEYLASHGVCIIEWADRVLNVLPEDRLTLTIAVVDENSRRFDCRSGGSISQEVLNSIRSGLE